MPAVLIAPVFWLWIFDELKQTSLNPLAAFCFLTGRGKTNTDAVLPAALSIKDSLGFQLRCRRHRTAVERPSNATTYPPSLSRASGTDHACRQCFPPSQPSSLKTTYQLQPSGKCHRRCHHPKIRLDCGGDIFPIMPQSVPCSCMASLNRPPQ